MQVAYIKRIKATENKLDLECTLRTRWASFCLVPVPTAPILHLIVISESMTTLHGSLWGNKHGNLRLGVAAHPNLYTRKIREAREQANDDWYP